MSSIFETLIAEIHNGVERLNSLLATQREQHHQLDISSTNGSLYHNYYEIRRTLRQLDQAMVSLEQELNAAKAQNHDDYTVATMSLFMDQPRHHPYRDSQSQYPSSFTNSQQQRFTNGNDGGCDYSSQYDRASRLSDTLINDLMAIVTLDTDTGYTGIASASNSEKDTTSIHCDDDSRSVENLLMAMIPIATRLLREVVTPELARASTETTDMDSNTSYGLKDRHVANLLIRIIETLQQDHPTDASTLLSCLELLNTHLTSSRLENVLSLLPQLSVAKFDPSASPQPVQSHLQCLAILQVLLPNCLNAMITEPAPSKSGRQQANQEIDEELEYQSLAWFQLRLLAGIFLDFLRRIMHRNIEKLSFELWLRKNLSYFNLDDYLSPETLRQDTQQILDLIRNYIVESVEYAVRKLIQSQGRQDNSRKSLGSSASHRNPRVPQGDDRSQSPEIDDLNGEDNSHLLLLQHATLASNALELQDDLTLGENDANRGLTRSLWRRLLVFVSDVTLDRPVQRAATQTLWKLAQRVVVVTRDPFEKHRTSTASTAGVSSPALLMDDDEASLLSITLLLLVEHADYFWTDENQNWIHRVLYAAEIDATVAGARAKNGGFVDKRGATSRDAFNILRHAVYTAALSTQLLPHPYMETGYGVSNYSAAGEDKRTRLLQLALSVGGGTNTSSGSANNYQHDDPWHPFMLRYARDLVDETH